MIRGKSVQASQLYCSTFLPMAVVCHDEGMTVQAVQKPTGEGGTGQECVMSLPNEVVEPTPGHWHLCASTFYIWNKWECFRRTHTVVLWWLSGTMKTSHWTCLWLCVDESLLQICSWKKKKSYLQSLEACRVLMVIIWDWKAMWEIGPYWFFFTGGILKAHPVLKLCFCTCCRKD